MTERYLVFDVETPNWHNDRMCSIGLCVVEGDAITEERYALINPEEEFAPFNIQIHGITPEMVADAPTFGALWPELEPLFAGSVLVAHNAPFDLSVLAKCLEHYRIPWHRRAAYACTCQMGRACIPDSPNHKLNTLCGRLGIALDHHNAASDSRACAQLLLYYRSRGLDVGRFRRTYDLTRCKTVKAADS